MGSLMRDTSDPQPQAGSRRKIEGRRKPGTEWATSGQASSNSSPATVRLKPLYSQKQLSESSQSDLRAQFYKRYRKAAEEYDIEFMEKYDEDLNTTLIFVRRRPCSGGHR